RRRRGCIPQCRSRLRAWLSQPPTQQAAFEPFISIADPGDGVITIYTASQMPSFVRLEIARLLGWPENRVRVCVPLLGGGFGAKTYIKLEALVAALALLVHRPVKIAATMDEQFFIVTNHPASVRIKSGVSKAGHITARECEVLWNGGPTPTSARASARNRDLPRPDPTTLRM